MQKVDYGKLIPWSPEQVSLIKETVAAGANLTNAELALFGYVAGQFGLDPLRRQMYAVRYERNGPVTFQVGVDGFRTLAKRSGKMRGYTQTLWCGRDGVWVDVWTDEGTPPFAARVGVRHADFADPVFATAHYSEYVATRWPNDDEKARGITARQPNSQWTTRPAHMLAKCAEALAIRTAFPEDVGGLYTDEEMDHVQRVTIDSTATEVTGGGPAEEERFGANRASLEDLIAGARDALQAVGGELKHVQRLYDWPGGGSIKEGLSQWARLRPEEDVVATLRQNLTAALSPQQEAPPPAGPRPVVSHDQEGMPHFGMPEAPATPDIDLEPDPAAQPPLMQ